MNQSVRIHPDLAAIAPPAELEALGPAPLLLPGENLEHYRSFRQAVFADIAPHSALEWLLAIDVAEASWEILRYRMLRHSLLESYRQKAIEAALSRVDLPGVPPEFHDEAACHVRLNALSWRTDSAAKSEIEARLASYGFDQDAINLEIYIQARETYFLFESLIHGAQIRRMLLLKEIRTCRSKY